MYTLDYLYCLSFPLNKLARLSQLFKVKNNFRMSIKYQNIGLGYDTASLHKICGKYCEPLIV